MKRLLLLLILTTVLFGFSVASATADPSTSGSNPQTQFRTFTCSDGNTYSGGFVGFSSADFFIIGSTGTFAIKVFSEYTSPGGTLIATFPTGIQGTPARSSPAPTPTLRASTTSSRASSPRRRSLG
jgi:hypothetical protein